MNTPKDIFDFLILLRENNNRQWFNDHKDLYEKYKADVAYVSKRFIDLVSEVEPTASNLTPAECVYRLYRDTRFSQDKSPYKTHTGIFVNPPFGKKSETLGWYLHLEPGNTFFAAGTGWSTPQIVKSLRQGIYDEIEEYRAIVESDEFKSTFTELGMDKLKTVPKGFPKDWEYVDYLRPRIFGATAPLQEEEMCTDNWLDVLRGPVEQGARYNKFCNYFIMDVLEDIK